MGVRDPRVDGDESNLLKFSVRFAVHTHVTSLIGAMDGGPSFRSYEHFDISHICALTGLRGSSVRNALLPNRALIMLGLLEDRLGGDFAPSRTILRIARLPTTSPDCLRSLLTGKGGKATLAWKDFAHLGEQAELAEKLIVGALRTKAHGVNVLLYGPPGTGKTEFARTLPSRFHDEPDGQPRSRDIASLPFQGAISSNVAGTDRHRF